MTLRYAVSTLSSLTVTELTSTERADGCGMRCAGIQDGNRGENGSAGCLRKIWFNDGVLRLYQEQDD